MIYGAPIDVAFRLSQSSLFRRCNFIYGLKEDRCCLIQQILLLTSCFPNRYIIQLEFCHSTIRAVIIPKKNLPGLIQKWGRVIIGVKSPHLIQSKLKIIFELQPILFPKKKTLPAECMNSVANTPVQIGLREFQELCHVYHG